MQMVKIEIRTRSGRATALVEVARRGRIVALPDHTFIVPEPALMLLRSYGIRFRELARGGADFAIDTLRDSLAADAAWVEAPEPDIDEPEIIDRGRGPEIAGTRITVYDVLDYLDAGWHEAPIASLFRISSRQVLAAIKYIEEHESEVRGEYQEMLERDARGNPPEIEAKLKESHEKLLARLEELRQARVQETVDAGHHG